MNQKANCARRTGDCLVLEVHISGRTQMDQEVALVVRGCGGRLR